MSLPREPRHSVDEAHEQKKAGAPAEPSLDSHLLRKRRAQLARVLHWQSKLVLLLVVPSSAVWTTVLLLHQGDRRLSLVSAAAGAALALLVWRAKAATPAGAVTGGLLMLCFCLTTPGWHSSVWPLLSMLVLTLGATRYGRARKQRIGAEESRHGRDAAQVAANLGVAALSGPLINTHGQLVALTVLLAALAEAAADTLASELGIALGGTPRMITTLRPVAVGTDGGVTLPGTALGLAGACVVASIGMAAMGLPRWSGVLAASAGVFGLLFDSLLGATLERRGWLNNDAVNFLSTLAAAVFALGTAQIYR